MEGRFQPIPLVFTPRKKTCIQAERAACAVVPTWFGSRRILMFLSISFLFQINSSYIVHEETHFSKVLILLAIFKLPGLDLSMLFLFEAK